MGIGRQAARAAVAAIIAGTTRATRRQEMADADTIFREWLAKRDAIDAQAKEDFATIDRPALFAAFVAGLAEPTVDQTP